MNPAWWLPIVALDYFVGAWLTYKVSNGGSMIWFWMAWAGGCLPLWTMIARYSKDIVFDGILFDVTMTLVYTASILYFTKSFSKLGCQQYLSLVFIVGGLVFFKRGT